MCGDEDRGYLNEGVGKTCVYSSRSDAVEDARWLNETAKKHKRDTVYEAVVYKDDDPETVAPRKKEPKKAEEEGLEAFFG
jgi:hypothetical protein